MAIKKEFGTGTLKYYSFYVGPAGSKYSTWTFIDIKMPAYSAREAIVLHHIMELYLLWQKSHWRKQIDTFPVPDYFVVRNFYRQVLEFEKKPGSRVGRVDYLRVGRYSQHTIKSWFKNTRPSYK
jgi:hypothetical protein